MLLIFSGNAIIITVSFYICLNIVSGYSKQENDKKYQNILCLPDIDILTVPITRRSNFQSRSRGDPTTERRFKCNRCNKSYIRNAHLHRHQKYECGKEPQFQCPFCNKKCKIKSNLTQHIITHFPKNDIFKTKDS